MIYLLFLVFFVVGCLPPAQPPLEEDKVSTSNPALDAGNSVNNNTPGGSIEWGDIYPDPAETFFASDLSDAVREGVTHGLRDAAAAWGNYGPLEYWVLGTDTDAGLELIEQFCDRRAERGQWPKEDCMDHQTRTDGEHNFMSYLLIGQEVVANNTPMGSMGRNGRRDWDVHLFTSSYPFGFDSLFADIPPEEETKTLFHEYFHAVQHAHISSLDFEERDRLLGPTWFVEGGAEYMANHAVSKGWADGSMTQSDQGHQMPSFSQRMEWKMIGGKENLTNNCPELSFHEISYADPCSYAAYELGAWGMAYLQHLAGTETLLDTFYPSLENLSWDDAFTAAFERTPEVFYDEFDAFLQGTLQEQLAILPEF